MPAPTARARITAALLLGSLALPAAAASDSGGPDSRKTPSQFQALKERIQDLQSKALQSHPDLQKRRNRLEQRVQKRMRDDAFPAEKRRRLRQLENALEGTAEDTRPEARGELQRLLAERRQARLKALQAPGIKAARKAFRKDLLAAMKEVDPRAPALVERLRRTARKLGASPDRQGGPSASGGGSSRAGPSPPGPNRELTHQPERTVCSAIAAAPAP